MFRLRCNNRGFTLVEVLIAIFITVVAVLGILALISPAWQTAARSDYLGRASGILYETLMAREALIMNPCCIVPEGVTGPTSVNTSGQSAPQSGDAQFFVTTTTTLIGTGVWRVTVRVTWSLNETGISESLVVTGQEGFRFPTVPTVCADRLSVCQ